MSEQRISTRARVLAIPAVGALALGISVFSRGGSAQDTAGTPVASPAASPVPSNELSVSAGDIFFDPKMLEGAANTDVKITVTNKGAAAHDFVIDALNVKTKMLNPGDTETVTVNSAAGDYQYYCSVPGHKEAGMVGTLTLKDVAAAEGDAAAAGGAQEVKAGDIFFDPKKITIPANTDAQVTVTNGGAAAHDFAIDDLGIKTAMLNPGDSETVTINAAAGEYQYYCTVPGHAAAGMVGKLIVQ